MPLQQRLDDSILFLTANVAHFMASAPRTITSAGALRPHARVVGWSTASRRSARARPAAPHPPSSCVPCAPLPALDLLDIYRTTNFDLFDGCKRSYPGVQRRRRP